MRTKHPKSLFVGLLLASFVSTSYGQCVIEGTVNDTNIGGPAVTDSLPGQRVPAGTIFLVALYYAPVDITDPALFMQTGSTTGFFFPGYFSGGTRYVPMSVTSYNFQVRIWESAYGSSYEQAVAAPEMNGRPALRAESNVFRLQSGGLVGGCDKPF